MKTTIQGLGLGCRPMIDNPPPFKGLNIRIPVIFPAKGRGFINQGFGLVQEDRENLHNYGWWFCALGEWPPLMPTVVPMPSFRV